MACEPSPKPRSQFVPILKSLSISLVITIVITVAAASTIPHEWWVGKGDGTTASRWTGELPAKNPWTRDMVTVYTLGDLLAWLAFATIARSYYLYHPRIASGASETAVICITTVFAAVASMHLMAVYTNFYPIYRIMTWSRLVASIVSIIGAIYMTAAMFRTAAIWENQQQFLIAAEKRQNKASELAKIINTHRYRIIDLTREKEELERQQAVGDQVPADPV